MPDHVDDEEFFPRAWVLLAAYIQRRYPGFTRENVEDAVGEAIVRYCRYRRDHEVREPMNLLYRIAAGAAADSVSSDEPIGGEVGEVLIDRIRAGTPSEGPGGPEMAALLARDWIARNRPEDLPIIEMRCQGLAHREIAERLGMAPEAIRKRYSRLIDEIRRHASEIGIDNCLDDWLDEDDARQGGF
jgi:DNA-directed RNA polymerase specialized sigma24 family protein